MLRILRRHYPFRSFALLIGESLGILAALAAGVFLRLGPEPILQPPLLFALKAALVLVVCQVVLFLNDLYEFEGAETQLELFTRILKALAIASAVLAAVYYFIPQLLFGRGVFALTFTLIAAVVFAWRLLYVWLMSSRGPQQKVLVVGCDTLAVDIAREVLRRKDTGVRVVGFLSDDPARVGERLLNPSIIGTYQDVCRLVEELGVDKLVVASRERRGLPVDDLLACKMKGVQVVDGINFFEQLSGKLMVESLRPSNLIFSAGFRRTKATRAAKRLLDLAASGLLLFVSAPVMALTALAIKLDSAGDVLFRQERVGEGARNFIIYKFRSMSADAESHSGPVWASEDDPRITRVGKWLRKFRLDELPQLWNVLKGDMSLVGPRPERPYFVQQLKAKIPFYDQRSAAKPGVTGWAQVRYAYGASEEDALEKLKYDLYYIKNCSVWLDLLILFETVRIVLFGRGSR
jgi:sugar transferase (PEP-CTERM system associated)